MKKMKKFIALVIALTMCMAISLPAMAATVEIKTSNDYVATRVFKAYQVFDADWAGEKSTNIKAGNGIDWEAEGIWTEIQGIAGLESVNSAEKLAEALAGKSEVTGRELAKVLKIIL